jgi:deoxyribonuclease-2
MLHKSLLFLVALALAADDLARQPGNAEAKLSCRNEKNGEELDWYTLYKLPTDSKVTTKPVNEFLKNGTAYMFMTNKNQAWTVSSLSINDSSSINAQTLRAYYEGKADNNKDLGYLVYNDNCESGGAGSSTRGHAKGLLLFDKESVVAIVHSIPKHPSASAYAIQPGQCVYGQSWFCGSFNIDQLGAILAQISYFYPNVCDSRIPVHLKAKYPAEYVLLKTIADGKRATSDKASTQELVTAGGEKLVAFAKSSYYGQDL